MERLHNKQSSKVVYHFVYKTINLINGNFYYGIHSTTDLDDGYLGSGLLIEKAIKKHGPNNFKREIIQFFPSKEGARELERQIVNEQLLENRNCYNRALGGQGGFLGNSAVKKMRKSKLGKPSWNSGTGRKPKNCSVCGVKLVHVDATKCSKHKGMFGSKNPACKGRLYITPCGVFETKIEAAAANGLTVQSFSRRLVSEPDKYKVQK